MRKVPLFSILASCTLSWMPTLAEGFEADTAAHATTQRELRLVNRSPEPLGPGTVTLYADDADGLRERVPDAVLQLTDPVEPGAPLPVLTFTPPTGATGYVVVFEGQLGYEEGAVVGIAVGRGESRPK